MFAGVVGWAGGAWNWFCRSPVAQIFVGAIGLLFAWSVTVNRLKAEGAREQKRIHEAASAKREVEIVNTITENSNELVRASERVRAADARVELPDGTQGLPPYHYRREDGVS